MLNSVGWLLTDVMVVEKIKQLIVCGGGEKKNSGKLKKDFIFKFDNSVRLQKKYNMIILYITYFLNIMLYSILHRNGIICRIIKEYVKIKIVCS